MWLGKGYCIAIEGLYCNLGGLENCIAGWKIVLQLEACWLGNCIARQGFVLQLGLLGWKIVLQYRELYCNEACK